MAENFFKARREELRLTQRDVSIALDMTTSAVSFWETETAAPRITLSERLAQVYQVTPARMREEIAKLATRVARAKAAAVSG